MISDGHRVTAYERALRALVKPGMTVLDAGAGTGLLAMLAARSGAGRVFAVESMPIAKLAHELVRHNQLDAIVEVIEDDLRTLAPRAPVDLIVSDCLGRFLLDDQMTDAMRGAFAWLAPGGVVIPSEVTLMLAPVAVGHFGVLDGFEYPTLGIDLAPARTAAERVVWSGLFLRESLMAEACELATWRLPGPLPPLEAELAFEIRRVGRLRGLAGWFRATLAPGVALDTAPGIETHWQQVLLPLPARELEVGDRLEVRVWLEGTDPEPRWGREGRIVRAGAIIERFRLAEVEPEPGGSDGPPRSRWRTAEGAAGTSSEALGALGAEVWEAGDRARARELFEDAVMALRPGEGRPELWENLGIARHQSGDWTGAIIPLMRALDGAPTSREQSLRLLVDACMRADRQIDGARYLRIYEATFGPHPAGWARS